MPNEARQPSYDIFVSYAHVDDEPPPGVDDGWVSTFVEGVKGYLARELGRKEDVRLWMDYELRGNQSVTSAIHNQLAAVKVLVPFLSKGYLKSDWCMEELRTFHQRVDGQGARIFPVYVSPVEQIPGPLADLTRYQFWQLDKRCRPRILGDPKPRLDPGCRTGDTATAGRCAMRRRERPPSTWRWGFSTGAQRAKTRDAWPRRNNSGRSSGRPAAPSPFQSSPWPS